jgi:hypothetical protein
LVIVFQQPLVSGFHEAELSLDDAKWVLHLGRMLAFMYSMLMAVLFLRMLFQGSYLAGRSAISQSTSTSASSSRCGAPW